MSFAIRFWIALALNGADDRSAIRLSAKPRAAAILSACARAAEDPCAHGPHLLQPPGFRVCARSSARISQLQRPLASIASGGRAPQRASANCLEPARCAETGHAGSVVIAKRDGARAVMLPQAATDRRTARARIGEKCTTGTGCRFLHVVALCTTRGTAFAIAARRTTIFAADHWWGR